MKYYPLFLLILIISCSKPEPQKNLVLKNGHVVTVDSNQPDAEAVVAANGKIIFVGSDTDAESYINPLSKVIDLAGRTMVPGFIDGHAHLWNLGQQLVNIDLSGIQSWHEAVNLVHDAVQKAAPGQWILGRGWHQEKWQQLPPNMIDGYPVHRKLSAASPNNPVFLKHSSGHAMIVNQKAMDLAGITASSKNPGDGIIIKDSRGSPTGVLLEDAMKPVNAAYNAYINTMDKNKKAEYYQLLVREAGKHCLQHGITSFQDAGSSLYEIDLLKKMADNNDLPLRLWIMISGEENLEAQILQKYRTIGAADSFLSIGAIKQYVDGALGTRGAWLLQPYSDMPVTKGINVTPLQEIINTAQLAYNSGYQLCTHAIGDRGNREMLDIYQQVLQGDVSRRWRIEHAQHLALNDISRFAELGVIASFQTVHCISDGPWVHARIGEQRADEGAYVWQKVLQSGAHIANGTDAPVESINVIENYYAAVTRKLNDGRQFYPGQVLSREQALASVTLWNAYAAFEEQIKGSIEVGKVADMVVLSQDLLTVPEDQILDTMVEMTILDGRLVYNR